MIIVGSSKALDIQTQKLQGINCKNCDVKNSLELHSFVSYGHVMFLPTFTEGKKSVVICDSCGKEYNIDIQPERIKEEARVAQEQIKVPLWHFSGLAIITLVVLSAIYFNLRDNRFDDMNIKDPKVGDVYEVEAGDDFYSLIKVRSVTKDSVFVVYNMQSVNQKHGLNDLNKSTNYWPIINSISRIELENMYEIGEIFEINRD